MFSAVTVTMFNERAPSWPQRVLASTQGWNEVVYRVMFVGGTPMLINRLGYGERAFGEFFDVQAFVSIIMVGSFLLLSPGCVAAA